MQFPKYKFKDVQLIQSDFRIVQGGNHHSDVGIFCISLPPPIHIFYATSTPNPDSDSLSLAVLWPFQLCCKYPVRDQRKIYIFL